MKILILSAILPNVGKQSSIIKKVALINLRIITGGGRCVLCKIQDMMRGEFMV